MSTVVVACGDDGDGKETERDTGRADASDAGGDTGGTDVEDLDVSRPDTTDTTQPDATPDTTPDTTPTNNCTTAFAACDQPGTIGNGFLCTAFEEGGANQCVPLCTTATATDEEATECPTGSICALQLQQPVNGFDGACAPSDCTSIFDSADECGTETCTPLPNDTNLCFPAGTVAAGAACVAGSEDAAEICAQGLICVDSVCTAPCDLDAETSSCGEGEECLELLRTTTTNRPGLCGASCEPFSSGQCGEGEFCSTFRGDAAICQTLPEDATFDRGAGEECDPAAGELCAEGFSCVNFGTEEAPAPRCAQSCATGDAEGLFATCAAELVRVETNAASDFDGSEWLATSPGTLQALVRVVDTGRSVGPLPLALGADEAKTVLAIDSATGFDPVLLTDVDGEGSGAEQGVRAIHGAPGAGDVDVYLGTLVVSGTGFGDATDYIVTTGAGATNLHLLGAGTSTIAASFQATGTVGEIASVFVLPATEGLQAVATSGPRFASETMAGLRVLHGTQGAGAVDIYVDCPADADEGSGNGSGEPAPAGCAAIDPVIEGLAYASDDALDYLELAAGTYALSVFPAGADASSRDNALLADIPATLAAGTAYTVVALPDGTGIELSVFNDSPVTALGAGELAWKFYHLAPAAPEVDIVAESATALATAFAPGDVFGGDGNTHAELAPATYTIALRAAGSANNSAPAFLAGPLALETGDLFTLVFVTRDGDIAVQSFSDTLPTVAAGGTALRVLHAAQTVGEVAISVQAPDAFVCFAGGEDNGSGVCISSCEPFPRAGIGGYEECGETDSCIPQIEDSTTRFTPAGGICIPSDPEAPEAGETCTTDGSFSCLDAGLCLAFAEGEDPSCRDLCPSFGEDACGAGERCNGIFMLQGLPISFCQEATNTGAAGANCTTELAPCASDNSVCLNVGLGSPICLQVCRIGVSGDCGTGQRCQNPGFDPSVVPAWVGVCQ